MDAGIIVSVGSCSFITIVCLSCELGILAWTLLGLGRVLASAAGRRSLNTCLNLGTV